MKIGAFQAESQRQRARASTSGGLRATITIASSLLLLLLIITDRQCAGSPPSLKVIDLKKHPDTAVYLDQKSTLGKTIKCSVSQKMFKLELGMPHCVFIADADNPKSILLYSPEHKLWFREPPSKLNVLGYSVDTKALFKRIDRTSPCTIAGIAATNYTAFPNTVIENDIPLPTLTSSIDDLPQRRKAPKVFRVTRAEYFASDALNIPQPAITVMSKLVHAPETHGLPLGLTITKSNGRRDCVFFTSAISYIHVDKDYFKCPASYKQARTDMECMFGSEKVGQLEDIFKDIGVGKDFGSDDKVRK